MCIHTCSVNCSFNCNGTKFIGWQWRKRSLERSNWCPYGTCYHHLLSAEEWSKSHNLSHNCTHIPVFFKCIHSYSFIDVTASLLSCKCSRALKSLLMHTARRVNVRRSVCSCRTTTLGSWSCGEMAHMAGVLPCRDKGSSGRTGQEENKRGKRLAPYVTEQLECIEISLGIYDVCKNLEHPGAKGGRRKLLDVQGLPPPSSRAVQSNKQYIR